MRARFFPLEDFRGRDLLLAPFEVDLPSTFPALGFAKDGAPAGAVETVLASSPFGSGRILSSFPS